MIIVYSMGRVGTTAIAEALNIVPVHYMVCQSGEWAIEPGTVRNPIYQAIVDNDLDIITPIRDPLSRIASAFEFQKRNGGSDDFEEYSIRWTLDWFDDEFIPFTGLDVYSQPFSKDGYKFYQAPVGRVLIIRTELLDSRFPALANQFGRTVVGGMPRLNEPGSYVWPSFSLSLIKTVQESKYAQHFWRDYGNSL